MALKAKVDWAKISSKLNSNELPKLNKFKSHYDTTTRNASVLPDSLPKINWAHYKELASNPKVVADLEKAYSGLKMEPPKVSQSRIDELEKNKKLDHDRLVKFSEYAQSFVESADEVIVKFKKMIPVKNMSLEDWALTFPEWSHTVEDPSLSPHYGRTPGLTRAEAAAYEKPDPLPFSTKQAWVDWEKRKHRYVD